MYNLEYALEDLPLYPGIQGLSWRWYDMSEDLYNEALTAYRQLPYFTTIELALRLGGWNG